MNSRGRILRGELADHAARRRALRGRGGGGSAQIPIRPAPTVSAGVDDGGVADQVSVTEHLGELRGDVAVGPQYSVGHAASGTGIR
jgi:hypothetical protein